MIVPHPTDEQLRTAHVITFFDSRFPEFHWVVANSLDRSKATPPELLVVDIEVDSTDQAGMQALQARIAQTRGFN